MPDRPAKFPRPGEPRRPGAAPAESIAKPKPSRPTAEGHTRLHLNVGAETGVSANDIVATILGHTGLPKNVVGPVDVRGRHTFVDVASEHARGIIAKLNRAEVKGRKARVKVA